MEYPPPDSACQVDEAEILQISDSEDDLSTINSLDSHLLREEEDDIRPPSSPNSSSSSSVEVIEREELMDAVEQMEEAPPIAEAPPQGEPEEMRQIPTPPPWNPSEPDDEGPDGIQGPPEEMEFQLEEDPFWDPIRPFLPSLVWLEQFKPGLKNPQPLPKVPRPKCVPTMWRPRPWTQLIPDRRQSLSLDHQRDTLSNLQKEGWN